MKKEIKPVQIPVGLTDHGKAWKAVNLRIPEVDYERLRGIFKRHELSMAGGSKAAVYYFAELLERGAVSMRTVWLAETKDLELPAVKGKEAGSD